MKKFIILAAALLSVACTQEQPQPAIYKQQELNTVSEGVLGTVLNKRNVVIRISEPVTAPQQTVVPVTDAQGRVTNVVTHASSNIQSSTREVPGYEYVVKLDAGKIINVTQSDDGAIKEDSKVYVFQYPDGKTRIVPATTKFLGIF
jgi:outer membrane lipoprotein SlyB